MFRRFFVVVAFVTSLLVLTACGSHKATRVAITPETSKPPVSTTTTTVEHRPDLGDWLAHLKWNQAVAAGVARTASRNAKTPARSPAAARIEIGTAISAVMACIRAHESGDYSEQSHPSGSSGAYQMEPATFRYYEQRAGYSGYEYAYQAPPAVQDAIVEYALTHGGAGNWSTRYGNDPCTAGLPGGG